MKINLGDKVRDPVTGIEGIAYVRYSYLQGCDRIGIQSPTYKNPDGKTIIPDLWNVDEPQLEMIERKVVKCQIVESEPTGGPSFLSGDTKSNKH